MLSERLVAKMPSERRRSEPEYSPHIHRPVAVSPPLVYDLCVALEKPQMNEKARGDEMTTSQDAAASGMNADMAEHERTYRGFLLVLKLSAAVTAVTLLMLYFFLAR
jgi:hypothetical protein